MRRILRVALVLTALGAIGWVGFGLLETNTKPSAGAPTAAIPATTYSGLEMNPALSPDGTRLAFCWSGETPGALHLYIKNIDSEAPLQITRGSRYDYDVAWSPDGQRLAIARQDDAGSAIWIVASTGTEERRLIDALSAPIYGLSWSLDGTSIAFADRPGQGHPFAIYRVDLETKRRVAVSDPPPTFVGDLYPSFSPDGQRIAFTRAETEEVQDVYVVEADGGSRRVTFDHCTMGGVAWNPDGTRLIVSSARSGTLDLWSHPLDGGDPSWMNGGGWGLSRPSTDRNRGWVAYQQIALDTNVWRADLGPASSSSGATVSSLDRVLHSTHQDGWPQPSPDGSELAFISTRSGHHEVWRCQADGSVPIRLTSLDGPFTSTPRWSPDGRWISFDARPGGSSDIYLIPRDGGALVQVTRGTTNDLNATWSPDGRSLYFASDRSGSWEIWKTSVGPESEDHAEQITSTGGYTAFESEAGAIYYTRMDVPGIWKLAPEPVSIVTELAPADWGNWSLGKRGIYYSTRVGTTTRLRLADLEFGEVVELIEIESMPPYPSLGVTVDGATVYYTRVERRESDLFLLPPHSLGR